MKKIKAEIPNRKELESDYESKRFLYEKMLNDINNNLSEIIKDDSSDFTIKGRIKSFNSYYNKILKRLKEFDNPDIVSSITDIIALRVICPFLENINTVESMLKSNYEIIDSEHKGEAQSFKEFGYVSIHHIIKIPAEILAKNNIENEMFCEVQVCTILQEAWAEVEHDLVYKNEEFSPFDEPLKRKLAALNANLTLSDILFQEIRDHQKKLKKELSKRRTSFFDKIEDLETLSMDPELISVDTFVINSNEEDKEFGSINKSEIDDTHNIDDIMIRALEAHNNNNYSGAVDIYSKILQFEIPLNIKVIIHIHRGIAYFAISDYVKSLQDFEDALKLDEDNFKAIYYRGIIQRVMHNYQFALDDLNRCIKMEPYKFYPYLNRAHIYFYLCKFPEAILDCELALKIRPDSEKAQKFLKMVEAGEKLYRNI